MRKFLIPVRAGARARWLPWVAVGALLLYGCGGWAANGVKSRHSAELGSAERPLRVMLVPADTGAHSIKESMQPLFNAVTKDAGLHFSVHVGEDYTAVVQAMAAGQVDLAFFGAVSFNDARRKDAAEFLAVAVRDNQPVYYAGVFHRKDSGMTSLKDLKGKRVAVGDWRSTSSFHVPMAMLVEAGLDPVKDLGKLVHAGSHSTSLAALRERHVDACFASYDSFEKAVREGLVDPTQIVPLARSGPIPNPPLAMHPDLDPKLKEKLRKAFARLHESDLLNKEQLCDFVGKPVDRYVTEYDVSAYDKAAESMGKVTKELMDALRRKAAEQ